MGGRVCRRAGGRGVGGQAQHRLWSQQKEEADVQSLSVFNTFPYRFRVLLFGWYGQLDSRENRGELSSSASIEPIRYIDYDELLFREVASSPQLEFLRFGVTLDERPTIPPVTTQPTTGPQPTMAPQALPVSLLLGVGVAVVVAALVVILIMTLVCVFGRRRNQPNR